MQRTILTRVIAALALAATAAPALAQNEAWRAPTSSNVDYVADGRLVDVSVIVDGSETPLYMKPGTWDRRYFQAFQGRNYSLQLHNNTGRRVGVLIAVDGLNVVNGERTSLSGREPMYVLDPYEDAVIRGWRTSMSDVRRFVFVDEQRSYAERTGQANGDMGWIRVLSFNESRPYGWQPWNQPRVRENETRPYGEGELKDGRGDEPRAQSDAAPPSAGRESARDNARRGSEQNYGSPAPQSNPGTGWGEQKWDPVQHTEFLAERNATDRITLRYEYASGLRALGIFPRRARTWDRERGEMGFAQPPRW